MAKIKIVGDAVVVTSAVKLEDYKKVKKYRPKALVLMGGEDNKEEIFRVGISSGNGSVKPYGIEFGKETRDENKLACITTVLEGIGDEDIKKYVADAYGQAILLLNKIEEKIPSVLAEIAAEESKILACISEIQ